MAAPTHHVAFQTTRWSLIEAVRSPDHTDRDRAIDELAARYRPSVYAFLRRRGLSPDDAADVCQGFFETVILKRDLFARAERGNGRLRTLVLAALENYVIDCSRREASRARAESGHAGSRPASGFRDEEGRLDLSGPTDRDCFEARWAIQVLEEAVRRCEDHFRSSGKTRHWELFHMRVLAPSIASTQPPPLQDLSDALGFPSPADAAAAVQTVKRRLATLLEQVVAEECDGADVRDELRHVSRVLSSSHRV